MCNHESFTYTYYGRKTTTQKLIDYYRQNVNANVVVHAIDLQGYSTKQVKGRKVNFIAGWNENILSYINLYEKGVSTLIEAIENYKIEK